LQTKQKLGNGSQRRQSFGWRIFNRFLTSRDRRFRWHKWRPRLGVLGLLAFRNILRERNLHDTSDLASRPNPGPRPPEDLISRRSDGKYNDLDFPEMGAKNAFAPWNAVM
jgi:hypothetical protein